MSAIMVSLAAQEDATLSLSHKYRAQQRVRAMAEELVASVLDVQLRQLQENNLEKRSMYADIVSMRSNIDQLLARDMQDVERMLESAQQVGEPERQRIVLAARVKIREIVSALSAERQRLHRRMQLARVAAQTRQLIDLQTGIASRTGRLAEEEPLSRERRTIEMLEDQRDVAALYASLVETLADVAEWNEPISAVASEGLRMLKASQVERELQKAEQSLAASRITDAEDAERAVVQSLKAMLEVVERALGIEGSDHATVSRKLVELGKKQEQLRTETSQANLREARQSESLAERQRQIHHEVEPLAESSQASDEIQSLAEQAQAASRQAEAKLFEGNQAEAMQQQGMVIRVLAEMNQRLKQAGEIASTKNSRQPFQSAQQGELAQAAKTPPTDSQDRPPDGRSESLNSSSSRPAAPADQTNQSPSQVASSKGKGDATVEADRQRDDEAASASPSDSARPTDQRDSRSAHGNSATEIAGRRYADDPWFAKLPPAIQQAIQARARRAAPRGYEERLKRYFESGGER